MAKIDMMGRINRAVQERAGKIQQNLDTSIPYGPNRQEMSAAELRKKFEKMSSEERQKLISGVGAENLLDMLNG